MCVGVIRKRPLCVRHFLKYAEHIESISLEYARMKQSSPEPDAGRTPTRVQPRRAAKRQQAKSERGTERRTKIPQQQLFSVREVRKGLETLIQAARDRDELQQECIFGHRRWTCRQCKEEEEEEKRRRRGPGKASYGEMDKDGAAGPGWETVSVPADYQFRVGNVSFAVDACCEPMVMIL